MKVPRFDIFSGTDNNAQWIEVVEGLESASRRMEFYAAKCPGKYFVFDCSEHAIVDSIDTSPPVSVTIESIILMIHELWGFQQHRTGVESVDLARVRRSSNHTFAERRGERRRELRSRTKKSPPHPSKAVASESNMASARETG